MKYKQAAETWNIFRKKYIYGCAECRVMVVKGRPGSSVLRVAEPVPDMKDSIPPHFCDICIKIDSLLWIIPQSTAAAIWAEPTSANGNHGCHILLQPAAILRSRNLGQNHLFRMWYAQTRTDVRHVYVLHLLHYAWLWELPPWSTAPISTSVSESPPCNFKILFGPSRAIAVAIQWCIQGKTRLCYSVVHHSVDCCGNGFA